MIIQKQTFNKVLVIVLGIITIATSVFYLFANSCLDIQLLKAPSWTVEKSLRDMELGYTYFTFQLAFILGFILNICYLIAAIQILRFSERGRKSFLVLLIFSVLIESMDYFVIVRKVTSEDAYSYIMIIISFLILTRKGVIQLFHSRSIEIKGSQS